MFDTHCHLNFHDFDADRADVIAQAYAAGVARVLLPAIDLETSRDVTAMAAAHNGLYCAVGVHPNSTATFGDSTLADLRALASAPKVVAIGEIGLDYYWNKSPKDRQAAAFAAQLELASALELPVIIHDRDAHEDTLAILEAWARTLPVSLQGRAGVLHSCSAPLPIAQRAVALGFYIGFTGPLTFKKSEELRAVARALPPDRLLVETDAPYLTPEPFRGKRNSPAYIPYIVDRLASIHGMTSAQMAAQTTDNALRLFGITP